jgi:hypothetical protein
MKIFFSNKAPPPAPQKIEKLILLRHPNLLKIELQGLGQGSKGGNQIENEMLPVTSEYVA